MKTKGAFSLTGALGTGKSAYLVSLLNFLEDPSSTLPRGLKSSYKNELKRLKNEISDSFEIITIICDGTPISSALLQELSILTSSNLNFDQDDQDLKARLLDAMVSSRKSIVIALDEFGRFLEGCANLPNELALIQDLAEIAARAGGKLTVVTALHQAVGHYVRNYSGEAELEFQKLQGRFTDIPFNYSTAEYLELIASANAHVLSGESSSHDGRSASVAAKIIDIPLPDTETLLKKLPRFEPLCLVSLILVAQSEIGQNLRTVTLLVGQAFEKSREAGRQFFLPDLYDLIGKSLRSQLVNSRLSTEFALSEDSLETLRQKGGSELETLVLKSISILQLFGASVSLFPSPEVVAISLAQDEKDVNEALESLRNAGIVNYKKFSNSYTLWDRSDFDLEQRLVEARASNIPLDIAFDAVNKLNIPVLASRHLYETGNQRWFKTQVTCMESFEDAVHKTEDTTFGTLYVLIMQGNSYLADAPSKAIRKSKSNSSQLSLNHSKTYHASQIQNTVVEAKRVDFAVTALEDDELLDALYDFAALMEIEKTSAELAYDRVARRVFRERILELESKFKVAMARHLRNAEWTTKTSRSEGFVKVRGSLRTIASSIADYAYGSAPLIKNELINRNNISSSAVAARNILCRRIFTSGGKQRLGIEGYPAEGGLYDSVIHPSAVHLKPKGQELGNNFSIGPNDPSNLTPAFNHAISIIRASDTSSPIGIQIIYDEWKRIPFGISEGLLPLLMCLFIAANTDKVIFYRDGIFRPNVDDVEIDYLLKDPKSISVRWHESLPIETNLREVYRTIINALSTELSPNASLLAVARHYVAFFDSLPKWVSRTMKLSRDAIAIRNALKRANNPIELLNFDLPRALTGNLPTSRNFNLAQFKDALISGLLELQDAFETQLQGFSKLIESRLIQGAFEQTTLRCDGIAGLSGDMRFESLLNNLRNYDGSFETSVKVLQSVIGKPVDNITDADFEIANLKILEEIERFKHLEVFSKYRDLSTTRSSIAIAIGPNERGVAELFTFEPSNSELEIVHQVRDLLSNFINELDMNKDVITLALIETIKKLA
ncbi:AAA family ATPase [Acidithrix ferrooxidans]|uniref:AAA family ATPase n=1 Tax=Acidithrix ferrooxidans TaxID=1280514 RepID=UPI001269BF9E|nr:AAA family ATPase [Acidithrix ferrooxidans]